MNEPPVNVCSYFDLSTIILRSIFRGPGKVIGTVCVCVCMSWQWLLNEVTFDLHIWHAGSSRH